MDINKISVQPNLRPLPSGTALAEMTVRTREEIRSDSKPAKYKITLLVESWSQYMDAGSASVSSLQMATLWLV